MNTYQFDPKKKGGALGMIILKGWMNVHWLLYSSRKYKHIL